MPGAMLQAMLDDQSEQSTQRTQQTERNVRLQDPSKSSSVPDAAEPVDNGKSEVFVCPPDHAHGANATCYGSTSHRCRCADCREGQRRRLEKRRKAIAYGRHTPASVDAHRAGALVNLLRSEGWTVSEISDAAGVSRHVISDASLHPERPMLASSEAKILGITALAPMHTKNVDSTGTVRRLQALVFMGWTVKELMRRIGSNEGYGTRLMSHPFVYERTRAKIAALYDELWDEHPPIRTGTERHQARRAKMIARRRGWVGPLAWDDIDNDEAPATVDPEELVDETAVTLAIEGRRPPLTTGERHVVVERLWAALWSDGKIAGHIGVSDRTVLRDRQHLELPAHDQTELEQARKAA